MSAAIHVTELNHVYGQLQVLKDLSFTIERGDFFVIIGPNGSGKTTLMKIVAGILRLQIGGLQVLNRSIRIMDLMEKLRTGKKVTVVMVSHDINLAAMYGKRLLLMKAGEIVSIGTPEEVLSGQTLEAAYGCPVFVDENPVVKCPRITPVPGVETGG